MDLEQIKKQIIFKQQKIKSLHRQIENLIKRESELIADENNCKQFNPMISEFHREHRCRDCGQMEAGHKS